MARTSRRPEQKLNGRSGFSGKAKRGRALLSDRSFKAEKMYRRRDLL
jgi:hypothetical protein